MPASSASASAPGGGRTPAHEVRDLLTFLALKRDLFVAEVGAAVADAAEGRLDDEVLSRDEARALLAACAAAAQARARRDHETAAGVAGLCVEQALLAAEAAGAGAVALDLGRTEDAAALERMRNLNAVLLAPGGAALLGKGGGARLDANAGRLDSLREEHARLGAERDALAGEAAALRERGAALQAQCAALLREKGGLAARAPLGAGLALAALPSCRRSSRTAGAPGCSARPARTPRTRRRGRRPRTRRRPARAHRAETGPARG